MHGPPGGTQQFSQALAIYTLVKDAHCIADYISRNAFQAQLVGNFDSSPTVEGETVLDKRSGKARLVEEALLAQSLYDSVCVMAPQPPLDEFLADVLWRLLAAGTQGRGAVHGLGWG